MKENRSSASWTGALNVTYHQKTTSSTFLFLCIVIAAFVATTINSIFNNNQTFKSLEKNVMICEIITKIHVLDVFLYLSNI